MRLSMEMSQETGVRIGDCRGAVQRLMQVSEGEMLGHSTERQYSSPRQMAMALAREFTGASLAKIGRHFRRDHSTVLHAIRRVAEAETRNPDFRIAMDRLRQLLTAQKQEFSERKGEGNA